MDQVAESRRTRRVKEGIGSLPSISAALGPACPIYLRNPGFRLSPAGEFHNAQMPAKPNMASPFNLMKYGSRVATCHSKKPSAGTKQRRSAKLRLNFVATVSQQAFIILLPIFGSFAHPRTTY